MITSFRTDAFNVEWDFEELDIPWGGVPGVLSVWGSALLVHDRSGDFYVAAIHLKGKDNRVVEITKPDHMWLWNRLVTAIYASEKAHDFFFAAYQERAA